MLNVLNLFERLCDAHRTIKLAKCKFAMVRAIAPFLMLMTKEFMLFLGLVAYFCSFWKKFSTVVAPLTDVLKGQVK